MNKGRSELVMADGDTGLRLFLGVWGKRKLMN
jgi:hypothetical protein